MYNRTLLMCRPDYFEIAYTINPWMDPSRQPDAELLEREYDAIVQSHRDAGHTINFIDPAPGLPDMTFTANHALVRGKRAIIGNLPPVRAAETAHTRRWLETHSYEVIDCPFMFSGQGDALPTGTGAVIVGREWRNDPRAGSFIHDTLGYEVIPIHTISDKWYDADMVVGIIRPGLVAICLELLDEASQQILRARPDLELILVSPEEANHFVLNLISDGDTVIMPTGGPRLAAELIRRGLTVVTHPIDQLVLGGGGIRCTALALDT